MKDGNDSTTTAPVDLSPAALDRMRAYLDEHDVIEGRNGRALLAEVARLRTESETGTASLTKMQAERDEAERRCRWWNDAALRMEREKNEAALVAQAATGALRSLGPAVGEVLHKVRQPDGAEASFTQPAPAAVIAFIVEQFKALLSSDPAALNYIEIQFTDATDGATYTAIIVKPDGKTPHQLRGEAEAEVARLRKRDSWATEYNVDGGATVEIYGDGWRVSRPGDSGDYKDFTEYLTPAGEWVRVVLSDDYPTHDTRDAAFEALDKVRR